MPFKIERSRLTLSISMLSILAFSTAKADTTALITPASPEACSVLESNAQRLSCYDAIFQTPKIELSTASHIEQPTAPLMEKQRTAYNAGDTIDQEDDVGLVNINPNSSFFDRRWELSPDSKLGTWNIRAYQPVYVLPAFWTSKKNEQPVSENPRNTVSPEEATPTDSIEMKYQISFKTKAIENIFGDNGDLWFAYTQSSRWQMYNAKESSPFRETNYEPEVSLVFRTNYNVLGLDGRLLGLTFNHQSNGRADPWSRSWNRVILNIGLERDNFALMIRPWYRVNDGNDDDNPDITDYLGHGDLQAFYRYKKHDFSLMVRHTLKGGEDSRGAVRFDWTFPIKGRLRGQFQIFDGYGESLIDYSHRATYVGLGVSLMDWF